MTYKFTTEVCPDCKTPKLQSITNEQNESIGDSPRALNEYLADDNIISEHETTENQCKKCKQPTKAQRIAAREAQSKGRR